MMDTAGFEEMGDDDDSLSSSGNSHRMLRIVSLEEMNSLHLSVLNEPSGRVTPGTGPATGLHLSAAGECISTSAAFFSRVRSDSQGLRGKEFAAATENLAPFLDLLGCGIKELVAANVATLAAKGATRLGARSVQVLVREEASRGGGAATFSMARDDSVTVAVLWNARILNHTLRFLEKILEARSLATDGRRLNELCVVAYGETLARHHTCVARSAANQLMLLSVPDRRGLFAEKLGFPQRYWDTLLRADLDALHSALALVLSDIADIFAVYDLDI